MVPSRRHQLLLAAILLAALLACRLPRAAPTEAVPPLETAAPSEVAPIPSSPTSAETPTVPPASPTPEPTPTVVHLMRPSAPGSVQSFMTDLSTKPYAAERRSNVDNFNWNSYERPFTSEVMDYQPHLDLVRAELSAISPWIYVTLFLEEAPPPEASPRYALEFDLDIDGRGDWLITALLPPTSDWTTDGVQVYQDTNNDVGGPHPLRADPAPQPTDGYDRLIFDQGLGEDPDTAWVRRSPASPQRIEMAFKHAILAFDDYLLWGAWADDGSYEPAWFDFNDHFTISEAGSPYPPSAHYPIRQLASLDNTCRWAYHFTPTEPLPGMCALPPTPTPVVPGTVRGRVFKDSNFSNSWDSGDSPYPGITVVLRSGGCSGSAIATTTTDAIGRYEFTAVQPGNYCVTVLLAAGEPGTCPCGGLCESPTLSNPRTITVPSGGTVAADFAYQEFGPC